jgi:hypothetical protein
MWFKDLKTRKATEVGTSLADHFIGPVSEKAARKRIQGDRTDPRVQRFLAQVDREVLPMKLGIFGRAKLANSFKWRLLDNGVEPAVVDELTRMLLLRMSTKPGTATG